MDRRPPVVGLFEGWMPGDRIVAEMATAVVRLASRRFPKETDFDRAAMVPFGREGNAFEAVAAFAAMIGPVNPSYWQWMSERHGVEPFQVAGTYQFGVALALAQAAEPEARRLWIEKRSADAPEA
jgi:hypothetical protein